MISFVAIALTYIYGTLLTANGSLKQLNIIALIGFGANFILNYYLIPNYGAKGAAIATLFTQFFVSITQIIVVKRLFKIRYELILLLKYLLLMVVGGLSSVYLTNIVNDFIYHSIAVGIIFSLLALILGLISKNQLIALLKSRTP